MYYHTEEKINLKKGKMIYIGKSPNKKKHDSSLRKRELFAARNDLV
jgi:hypothetical protein